MTRPRSISFRKHAPILRILAPALVLLGVCVFAWGLKYKLSLYDPPRAGSHHMPAAKLLTGNERRALPAVDHHALAGASALTLFTVLFFGALALKGHSHPPGFSPSDLSRLRLWGVPACAPSAVFFIRPPPRIR